MTRETEFAKHYKRFHENIGKSRLLLGIHPEPADLKAYGQAVKAVPQMNDCFVQLLHIADKRLLRVLNGWKDPEKVMKLARAISDQRIGGHLTADVVWTFWKYSHVVSLLSNLQKNLDEAVLLEQAIVTSCTALESFLKEMIPWVLKNHSDSARRYLGSLNRPIKELGKYGFDPMGRVDEIYRDETINKQLPVFPDLVEFYEGIIKVRPFETGKQRDFIAKVFEVRHCIVHNAGRPDARWRTKMKGAEFPQGQRFAERAVLAIDDRLHDVSVSIYKALSMDLSEAPFAVSAGKESTKTARGAAGQ